jgi:dienelactone hydrolase
MRDTKVRIACTIIVAVIFVSSIVAAHYLNTDFGNIDTQQVSITSQQGNVSGLLYRPIYATATNPQPAVVLAHGISGSKQYLSGIALELARNSIVALTIDLLGHGGSDGRLADGNEDPSLGMLAAVRYLETQTFVNSSTIGLVGHSLGAGATRATAVAHSRISATVLIAGGFGSMVADPVYGTFNSTFPENLLVAVGKYDVLFNLNELKKETLPPVFETSTEVAVNTLYGDFSSHNARKLVTPPTTHLFEPVDPIIASETIKWLVNALQPAGSDGNPRPNAGLALYRDASIFIGLVTSIGLLLLISTTVFSVVHYPKTKRNIQMRTKAQSIRDWKVLVIWGSLSLVLFFPMTFVGFAINIPPVIFGASIAWWTLATAIIGFCAVALWSRFSNSELNLKAAIMHAFDIQGLTTAVLMFISLYILAVAVAAFAGVDLGIIVPFFRALMPTARIPVFFMFIPFFLVYFTVEGLYLHELRQPSWRKSVLLASVLDLAKTASVKVSPYLAVLLLQYVPFVLFGFQLFPSFAGFLIEFFWLLTPIFVISTACSWWFHRSTSRIGLGAAFNALIFAWIAASLFPF